MSGLLVTLLFGRGWEVKQFVRSPHVCVEGPVGVGFLAHAPRPPYWADAPCVIVGGNRQSSLHCAWGEGGGVISTD